MDLGLDEARLVALELVVRRLAQRAVRNHPRAFEDLERELVAMRLQTKQVPDAVQAQLDTLTCRARRS